MNLKGKTILITGASRGIGRAVAKCYAQLGANLILISKDTQALEELHQEIPTSLIHPVDLEYLDTQQAQQIADAIEDNSLYGILHNAGILGNLSPLANYNPQIWQKVMQINLYSTLLLTQALLPKLASTSRLIFTTSSVGTTPRALWGAYAISKSALESMAQIFTQELEHTDIRVLTINPGACATDMRQKAYPAENRAILKTPQQITSAYLYAMSDSCYSGEVIKAHP